jgi:hypothetical protein
MSRITKRKEPAKTPLTQEDAIGTLTAFERLSVKNKLGFHIQENPEIADSILVWILENRGKSASEAVAWKEVGSRSVQEIEDYFADEDPDPESEQANFEEE